MVIFTSFSAIFTLNYAKIINGSFFGYVTDANETINKLNVFLKRVHQFIDIAIEVGTTIVYIKHGKMYIVIRGNTCPKMVAHEVALRLNFQCNKDMIDGSFKHNGVDIRFKQQFCSEGSLDYDFDYN